MTHAWLFTGPPGSGRSNAARAFAAALQCERRTAAASARPAARRSPARTPTSPSSAPRRRCSGSTTCATGPPRRARAGRSALAGDGHRGRRPARHASGRTGNALLKASRSRRPRPCGCCARRRSRTCCRRSGPAAAHVTLRDPATARRRRLPGRAATASPERWPRFAARASQGHIGRARALALDEETRNRRREVVAHPGPPDVAGRLHDRRGQPRRDRQGGDRGAHRPSADARELQELEAIYGDERRRPRAARLPRRPRRAAAQPEAGEKRRVLDVIDRALMDMVSVYRDAIALQTGAPGLTRQRGAARRRAGPRAAATPEENLRRIDAIFTAREQMMEFNMPPQLALESMTVALRLPGGRLMKKTSRSIAVLALALTAFLAVGLAVGRKRFATRARRSGRRRRRPTPPPAAVTEAPSPALADSTPSASTGSPARPTTPTSAASSRCRSTTPTRRGETIDLALLRVPAERLPRRLPGGEPGRSRRPRDDVRRRGCGRCSASRCSTASTSSASTRAASAPRPRSTASADAELDGYLGADPTPDTAAEARTTARRCCRSARAASPAPATWRGHVTTVEAARDMDVLRAALGERDADLLRRVLRHQARRDVRRPVPRPGRPDGARRRASTRLPRRRDAEPRAGHRVRDRAAGLRAELRRHDRRLLPRRHRRRGHGDDHGLLDAIEEEPLPAGSTASSTVGNAFYGIIAPLYNRDYWSLLSTALAAALDGDGSAADAAGRRLRLAQPRRQLRRQPRRGDLRDQLPRRPDVGAVAQVSSLFPEFEEASPTFGRIFAWGLTLCRGIDVPSSEEPLDDPRRGCRADRGRRHHAATRPRRWSGRRPWPTSSTPACWSAATATGTPPTTPATSASTRRRGLPARRRRARRRHDLLSGVSPRAPRRA